MRPRRRRSAGGQQAWAERPVPGRTPNRGELSIGREREGGHQTVEQAGQNYRVRVQSNALARDVYVTFGDLDTTASDNYFDLLPGESVDMEVKSKASLADLRRSLQVISLVDALLPGTGTRTTTAQTRR